MSSVLKRSADVCAVIELALGVTVAWPLRTYTRWCLDAQFLDLTLDLQVAIVVVQCANHFFNSELFELLNKICLFLLLQLKRQAIVSVIDQELLLLKSCLRGSLGPDRRRLK
jgi:hypothetical protein